LFFVVLWFCWFVGRVGGGGGGGGGVRLGLELQYHDSSSRYSVYHVNTQIDFKTP